MTDDIPAQTWTDPGDDEVCSESVWWSLEGLLNRLYPTMSDDLTARIADQIKHDHRFIPVNHSSIGSEDHCGCEYRPRGWQAWADHVAEQIVKELDGEFTVTKMLLAATQEQLNNTVKDFCILRDALPRERVAQLLESP